ncbi:MAG: type II toxin-antitoxin system VapC family toxin [Lentisphaerota bacterium]
MRGCAIVFDSWAVLAYLQGEASAVKVRDILLSPENGGALLMSVVNLGEIWYAIARRISSEEADISVQEVMNWGIEVVDADWTLSRQAAVFKSKYKISYADAFAAALAKTRDAVLLTGDNEFKQIEKEIKIKWLSK